jgi:hypothetical protein
MTIEAKIVEHSVADHGKRLATYQLRYPRFIHAELMTHRVFSRNASSSRAIPVAKLIAEVRHSPAMPIHWGKNQPGMQANEECDELIIVPEALHEAYGKYCGFGDIVLPKPQKTEREHFWQFLGWLQTLGAEAFATAGYHKQIVNRRLEADSHISVILTATEFDNWNELRAHKDAQPEIHKLALCMQEAERASTPVFRPRDRLIADAWHLPYVTAEERANFHDQPLFLAKLSAARCARVSYLNHDGSLPDPVKDIDLYEKLVGGRPLHASPVEHQAYPLPLATQQSKNFFGWRQHRELVEHDIFTTHN